jgi:hypothetical protein
LSVVVVVADVAAVVVAVDVAVAVDVVDAAVVGVGVVGGGVDSPRLPAGRCPLVESPY